MQILKIKKSDLDKDNKYIGKENLSDYSNPFDGHIEIDEYLGYVKFEKSIVIKGSLVAKAGSGIKAGEGIEAGWGIKAGSGIEAGWGIVSLHGYIKAMLKISISAKCTIVAGAFSVDGAQEVEAQEIAGNVAYGNIKILDKTKPKESLSGKTVMVEVDGKKYEAVIK